MGKTLARDVQVLLKILTYMDKIKSALKRYQCKTSFEFALNEDCMDICSFCILQIDSLSRQLTTDSYQALNFISTGNLVPVRNMIAHDYIKLNRQVLFSFVQDCIQNGSYDQVKNRIKYCQEHKNANE
jgi:uncharacterized protein with HEPN domain